MGYSLWKFVLLALAASSQQTAPARPNIANQTFEVDVVFPRPVWQTYAMREYQTFKANEMIPLVLAVQNLTDWTIGNQSILWEWFIYSRIPGQDLERGRILDNGVFQTPDAVKTDPAFLVAVTNSSTWYQGTMYDLESNTVVPVPPKVPGETYVFQWNVGFDRADYHCFRRYRFRDLPVYYTYRVASIFDVLSESEQRQTNVSTAAVAIPQAPQCPEANGLYLAHGSSNATEIECPVQVTTVIPTTPVPEETNQGNPCAVQINNAIASSISSRITSAVSALTATSTTTKAPSVPTSTSKGDAGIGRPVQTAMAVAACLLCGLAVS